jgi:large subunit ribosomal protein L23
MNVYQVIKEPIITEKSQRLAAQKKYAFAVAKEATRKEVARAVEEQFKDVEVSQVNVVNIPGKEVHWRRRGKRPIAGKRSDVKKAIVTLKKGKIDLFEEKK